MTVEEFCKVSITEKKQSESLYRIKIRTNTRVYTTDF